ncbi:MAG: DUF2752 domain-containing protein [Pirellulaceae bacterium]|nr:DUF2752 domain-containing protein [Pirellulaceae bacterium]
MVAIATGLLSLLLVAAWLPPDPRGFGTHQRLGLPPCSFRQLTGWRCPSCGMTTAWSCLMRGRIAASFQANAGGALLGLVCLVVAPWALISGLRGRWLGRLPGPVVTLGLVPVLLVVTLADWLVRCLIVGR